MRKIIFIALFIGVFIPLATNAQLVFKTAAMINGAFRFIGPTVTSSAPFTPTDISGLQLWLKADSIVGLNDGDTLVSWDDSSGAGHNVSSVAGTPIYKTNIVNGKPVIRCDADRIRVNTFSGVQPTSIFVVAYRRADGSAMSMFDGTSQFVQLMYFSSASGALAMFSDATQISGTAFATANWGVVESNFNGGSSNLYSNGTSIASGSVGSLGAGGVTLCESGGGSFSWDGDIAEVLYYDSTLSAGNRQKVGQYLCTKYAITCSY